MEAEIERHCAFGNVRGIIGAWRADASPLADRGFQRGFGLLERYNLVGQVFPGGNLDGVWNFALHFPHVPIAIPHAGLPSDRSQEAFQRWRRSLTCLAEAENVRCKVSGLVMADQ